MNHQTDQQLLRDYAGRRSDEAFTELVRRHADFVYSAALRMVRDTHLAEDVTQGAFMALAQNARQLAERPVLSGWLHRTAQNLAANTVRSDVRRRAREQEVAAMNELLATEADANWENIAPQLDAGLGELDEADRDVLLLRYFERKSAREMAQILGTSEDVAQKRVSRAVERLREFFSKRNVAIGASGLAAIISANAVQAAPVGLAAAISTATLAGTAATTSTIIAATKTIAMTTLQKTIIGAALTAAVGAGVFEAHQASQLRDQVQTLQQQQAPLAEQIQRLQSERDDATNRLAGLREENLHLKSNPDLAELFKLRGEVTLLRERANNTANASKTNTPMEAEVRFWLARVQKLKNRLQQSPDKQIPEFQFMTENSWMFASEPYNDSDFTFESAAELAQGCAKRDFAEALFKSLQKYSANNGGQFPSNFSQLQPYFDGLTDTSVFNRYEFTRAKLVTEINLVSKTAIEVYRIQSATPSGDSTAPEEWVVIQKSPLGTNDARIVVSSTGVHSQPFQ